MKLPELAKAEGEAARTLAAEALGATLFWMGRFGSARKCLPPGVELGWALALLGEHEAARAPDATLYFFLDQPAACLACSETPAEPQELAHARLLFHWARSRLGQATDEAAAQAALATLRRMSPREEARGLAVHALAAFARHPVYALPHLDHALDQCARFGLHHLDARLLGAKAAALAAAGFLRDAGRFEQAAREAERRQAS